MSKIKRVVFILLFLSCFLFVDKVYATECTDNDLSTLRALAEKIEFSKSFIEGEDERGNAFSLIGHNLNSNLSLHFPNGLEFVASKTEQKIMTLLDGNELVIEVLV